MTSIVPGPSNYGINDGWFDKYTVAHAASGALISLGTRGRASFWTVLALAAGWEILERGLKATFPSMFPYASQDSLQNAVVDVAAVMLGWWLAEKLPDGAWL